MIELEECHECQDDMRLLHQHKDDPYRRSWYCNNENCEEYLQIVTQNDIDNRNEARWQRAQERAFTSYWEGGGSAGDEHVAKLRDAGRIE